MTSVMSMNDKGVLFIADDAGGLHQLFPWSPTQMTLSHQDARTILKFGAEIDTVDAEGDPLEPFQVLLEHIKNELFPPISVNNCIESLNCYFKLNMTKEFKETMAFLHRNRALITLAQFQNLDPKLLNTVFECIYQPNHTSSDSSP